MEQWQAQFISTNCFETSECAGTTLKTTSQCICCSKPAPLVAVKVLRIAPVCSLISDTIIVAGHASSSGTISTTTQTSTRVNEGSKVHTVSQEPCLFAPGAKALRVLMKALCIHK
eukprot:5021181-Amphidinium_carterae.1